MKQIIIIFTFLILGLVSCSTTKNQTNQNSKTSKKFVDMPKEYVGFWVDENYIKSLEETKSTRKTCFIDSVCNFYRIDSNQHIMYLSIHDGAGDNLLLMNTKKLGREYSTDSTDCKTQFVFENGFMFVDNRKYIHTINQKFGWHELVNSCFIAGNYIFDESLITFYPNGSVSGLNNFKQYRLNLDYIDMGMDDDLIYFLNMDGKNIEFIYEIEGDNLNLHEVICKSYEGKHCAEIERGKIVYILSKQE